MKTNKKIPNLLFICGMKFKVKKDKKERGASFSFENREIILGIDYKQKNTIFKILIHEISEIIHVILSNRYTDTSNDSYLFVLKHKDFEIHNDILVDTLIGNNILII